jgi:glutathione S-transferase
MKLYYSPGACSLSPHIVAQEAGIALQLEKVDLKAKKTASGADYLAINPKGYVPALQLDDGEVLTEGPAIVQYLGDRKPASGIVPAAGTMARYRLQEALTFINGELHKNYGPLFNPATAASLREEKITQLKGRYALIERQLQGRQFLVGDKFSAADAYLFTVTRWAGKLQVDLSAFPNLQAFQKRVEARPAVQAAMQAEGLLQQPTARTA